METRHWDEMRRITVSLRVKEEEQDYRYFPEPDLVPMDISAEMIQNCEQTMPEMPEARKQRLICQYGISPQNAQILTSDKGLVDFFEESAELYSNPKEISNWLVGNFLAILHERNLKIDEVKVLPRHLSELLNIIDKGIISRKLAKSVLQEMIDTGKMPNSIVKEKNLRKITDLDAIEKSVDKIFQENCEAVKDARKDEKAINYLVGQVMKVTKGQVDPEKALVVIRKKLSEYLIDRQNDR